MNPRRIYSLSLTPLAAFILITTLLSIDRKCDAQKNWYNGVANYLKAPPPKAIYTRGMAHSFLGIPYALRSNGTNAFTAPQPMTNDPEYSDQVNLDFGPYCPQMVEMLDQPDRSFFIGQQDCLTLNVFQPDPSLVPSRKYPVYVVIHPGGLTQGSARELGVQGIVHNLVARNLVVVTVEYRLGIYGLFNLRNDEDGTSMRSMRDVIMALKWVKTHIKDFAGNASAVTLGGWSSGACMVSWLTKLAIDKRTGIGDFFQQAGVHSGTADLCWIHFHAHVEKNASEVIANEICGSGVKYSDKGAVNKCIQENCGCKDNDANDVCDAKTEKCTKAALHPDGALFTLPPATLGLQGMYLKGNESVNQNLRVMYSWTREEWATIHARNQVGKPDVQYNKDFMQKELFAFMNLKPNTSNNLIGEFQAQFDYYTQLYKLNTGTMNQTAWYRFYVRFMSDYVFRAFLYYDGYYTRGSACRDQPDCGHNDVFFFQFDYANGPFPSTSDPISKRLKTPVAGHLADLPYVFMPEQYFKPGEHNSLDEAKLLKEWRMADVMGHFIADFVKQRPLPTKYFTTVGGCTMTDGNRDYPLITPWVTHLDGKDGFSPPDKTTLPLHLPMRWDRVYVRLFGRIQGFGNQMLLDTPSGKHPCPFVTATDVSDSPLEPKMSPI